jgi:hypothetical protein
MTGEWQPIETAPKDGTPVLIHVPTGQRPVYEAEWHRPWESAPEDKCWWQTRSGMVLPEHATHWMPLPEPPR